MFLGAIRQDHGWGQPEQNNYTQRGLLCTLNELKLIQNLIWTLSLGHLVSIATLCFCIHKANFRKQECYLMYMDATYFKVKGRRRLFMSINVYEAYSLITRVQKVNIVLWTEGLHQSWVIQRWFTRYTTFIITDDKYTPSSENQTHNAKHNKVWSIDRDRKRSVNIHGVPQMGEEKQCNFHYSYIKTS